MSLMNSQWFPQRFQYSKCVPQTRQGYAHSIAVHVDYAVDKATGHVFAIMRQPALERGSGYDYYAKWVHAHWDNAVVFKVNRIDLKSTAGHVGKDESRHVTRGEHEVV